MSLSITLSGQKEVVTQPQETVTLNGEVSIRRIVDIPGERQVVVFVDGLGRINWMSLAVIIMIHQLSGLMQMF